MGGDHWNAWQNCGVYTEPVTHEFAVHSLEHGAVWIAYDDGLPDEQVAVIRELAAGADVALVLVDLLDMPDPWDLLEGGALDEHFTADHVPIRIIGDRHGI